MDIYRVSFLGHREVHDFKAVEEKLTKIISQLIQTKEFVEFQIGRNGEFDIVAASCIKRVQKSIGNQNSAMTLVLPYPVADMEYYEKFYDQIFIPEEAERAHYKSAILKRNEWLVKNSELIIAYVHRDTGGAAKALKFAEMTRVKIIRI